MIKNQITLQEARRLFDYRDGMLFWRCAGSGHRLDRAAISQRAGRNGGVKKYVRIGGAQIPAHYAVWNWHHGITYGRVFAADGDNSNTDINNLIETKEFISPPLRPQNTECPCCAQPVPVPALRATIVNARLRPVEEKILRAVWAGDGLPVSSERIFDAMYVDDPDGGPSSRRMYAAFKVALCHLRKRLEGSGVGIENAGYRAGYRLVLGGK